MVAEKIFVLKLNIFQGWGKRELNNLLLKIPGVHPIAIDAEQGLVTIAGTADPHEVIEELEKHRIAAVLFEQRPQMDNYNMLFDDVDQIQQLAGCRRLIQVEVTRNTITKYTFEENQGGGGGGSGNYVPPPPEYNYVPSAPAFGGASNYVPPLPKPKPQPKYNRVPSAPPFGGGGNYVSQPPPPKYNYVPSAPAFGSAGNYVPPPPKPKLTPKYNCVPSAPPFGGGGNYVSQPPPPKYNNVPSAPAFGGGGNYVWPPPPPPKYKYVPSTCPFGGGGCRRHDVGGGYGDGGNYVRPPPWPFFEENPNSWKKCYFFGCIFGTLVYLA